MRKRSHFSFPPRREGDHWIVTAGRLINVSVERGYITRHMRGLDRWMVGHRVEHVVAKLRSMWGEAQLVVF